MDGPSPYVTLPRAEWARLRANTPLTLTEADVESLRGLNEDVSLDEVVQIYLPLSRLLNLYVAATQQLHSASDTFLGTLTSKVPFLIGVAGSVAVGKSTTARFLQALLARWPDHPTVDLVTTDGFLWPNTVLLERGLMQRKGFPESYDVRSLVRFVSEVKSGVAEVRAPVYSHLTYDIVPGEELLIRQPDIVIVEGLNVLQTSPPTRGEAPLVFVSDFFDFSIYVDADQHDIEQWYVDRFLALCRTAFQREQSYFHRYASLSPAEAREEALHIWSTINAVNLRENIHPTRNRADLVLRKAADHSVQEVLLRRL